MMGPSEGGPGRLSQGIVRNSKCYRLQHQKTGVASSEVKKMGSVGVDVVLPWC